jgi:UDP-N-acetylglucosamine acyltransferase
MAVTIHPTAIVDPVAELGEGVDIGAFSIVEAQVRIGARTRVGPHVLVKGHTTIGEDNHIYPFSSIGEAPQDKKYRGEPTRLEIGHRNTIRESCTLNVGTPTGTGVTRIGDDNLIMAYVHIAHDCRVGNHTIFANCTQLAGHVEIDDWAILGGYTGVHQFCRVGVHVITGVGSVVLQDVAPYVMAAGQPCRPHGINAEGLRRRGFAPATIAALKRAYRTLYRSALPLAEARRQIAEQAAGLPELRPLAEFIESSRRGLAR